MTWVDVSCPRTNCGLNRRINGMGKCLCGALLIYRPSARRKKLDVSDVTAFQWYPDPEGPELVHPDNGDTVSQERGRWLPVQTSVVLFEFRDRRKTARTPYRW